MKKNIFLILFLLAAILFSLKVGRDVFAEEKPAFNSRRASTKINLFQVREENLRQHLNSLNQIIQVNYPFPNP